MTISESAPQQRVPLTGIRTTAQGDSGTAPSRASAPWIRTVIDRLNHGATATITVTAASSDTTLIPTPTVSYSSPNTTGVLLFRPVANASGQATLFVTVADGQNTPVTRSFTVTVNATTNVANPTVVLTAPAMNASYNNPATISLAASVNANGHSISKVQFFAGANLIAEDTAAPYSANWECGDTGSYSLVARALYESNAFVDSSAVTVRVTAPEESPEGDLPLPWETADIGSVTASGSVSVKADDFEVAGAGTLAGNTDNFRFLYQTLSADGEIRIRVNAVDATGSGARAGVMIRENLTSGSRCTFLGLSPDGMLHWQSRDTTGASASDQSMSGGSTPVWLRLVRRGDLIVGLRSTNGSSWRTVGLVSIPMASNIYLGVAVASGHEGTLNTSSFSSPTVQP
jgi:regulation of enolase protein 1 (concanavalin A-like superfamily)